MELPNSQSSKKQTASISTVEEIGIIIAAQDLTPTMMSQDFLKFSGIVPKDWELSQQPILSPSAAQLSYVNGVNITAQPRTITLSETLNNKQLEDIAISQIAVKYIEKLPLAEYLGVSFSPKILVPFPKNPQAVRLYITERLLNSGSWKNIGQAPVQAGINLTYSLERCQLSINIAEARLQQQKQPPVMALFFSGSFNYNVKQSTVAEEKVKQLKQALSFWQQDFQDFRDIVHNRFLSASTSSKSLQDESVFPSL